MKQHCIVHVMIKAVPLFVLTAMVIFRQFSSVSVTGSCMTDRRPCITTISQADTSRTASQYNKIENFSGMHPSEFRMYSFFDNRCVGCMGQSSTRKDGKKSGYIIYIRKHNGKKEEWKIFDREEKLVYDS